MQLLKTISLAAILGFGITGNLLAELPQINDARVIQPPPGAKVAAAYFTITNPGSEPLEILDASSDIAARVEVHLSFVENDIAKMQKQDSVVIPAGESLEFKHGSYHVMFMGLSETLVSGNAFDLVLETSAGPLPVTVPVISPDASSSMQGMKHDMNKAADHDMKEMQHNMGDMKKDAMHDMKTMQHDMKEAMPETKTQ